MQMIGKRKVDNFILIMPKSWYLMVTADRKTLARPCSFLESMHPENMIKENKNIPLFVFKYFVQTDISGLINETLEKTCLFHCYEVDGHGIISALVIKLRRHSDFLDQVQATELVERFAKKKRGKNAMAKDINFLPSILNIDHR